MSLWMPFLSAILNSLPFWCTRWSLQCKVNICKDDYGCAAFSTTCLRQRSLNKHSLNNIQNFVAKFVVQDWSMRKLVLTQIRKIALVLIKMGECRCWLLVPPRSDIWFGRLPSTSTRLPPGQHQDKVWGVPLLIKMGVWGMQVLVYLDQRLVWKIA